MSWIDIVAEYKDEDEPSTRVDYYYDELSKARKRIDVLEHRTKTLLRLAKIEREHFLGVSEEWEDERDRYQAMMGLKDVAAALFREYKRKADAREIWIVRCRKERDEALKERDEAREWTDRYWNWWIRRLEKCNELRDDISEARRWAIHFRGLYEQGAPMTIAGMNTRIAELEDELEDEKHWFQLAIKERDEVVDLFFYHKKKSDRRKVTIQKIHTLSLKNRRLRNEMIAELEDKVAHLEMELEFFMGLSGTRRADISSEVVDNLHKDFVERYKKSVDNSTGLPYAYPMEDDNEPENELVIRGHSHKSDMSYLSCECSRHLTEEANEQKAT